MSDPFRLSVNGQHEFNLQPEDAKELDVVTQPDGTFHVLMDGKAHHAALESVDYAKRLFVLRVGGDKFEVKISDRYERLIQQLGLGSGAAQKTNQVKAPMPGLVLNIMVAPGQAVQKGDTLLILEAMKMENVIKAAGDAVIKSVAVQKGAAVEKGHLLISFE